MLGDGSRMSPPLNYSLQGLRGSGSEEGLGQEEALGLVL